MSERTDAKDNIKRQILMANYLGFLELNTELMAQRIKELGKAFEDLSKLAALATINKEKN